MRLIELPYIYKCHGKAPQHRKDQDFYVVTKGIFEFPEVEMDDVELALVHSYTNDEDRTYETPFYKHEDKIFRAYSDGLVRDLFEDVTPESFENIRGQWNVPLALKVPSTRFHYGYGSVYHEDSIKRWDRVQTALKEEAFMELQAKIHKEFMFIEDGDKVSLFEACTPPAWRVVLNENDPHVGPMYNPAGESQYNYFLPAEMKSELNELADWYKSQTGYSLRIEDTRDIEVKTELPAGPKILIGNATVLTNFTDHNVINYNPYGDEVDNLVSVFREEQTLSSALAFVLAFEEAATAPGAKKFLGGRDAKLYFGAFWKIYEMLPDAYKIDDAPEHIDDSSLDEELSSFGM